MPVALSRIKDAVLELRRSSLPERPHTPAIALVNGRAAGAATFLLGALAAFLWANTTRSVSYFALRDTAITVSIGGASLLFNLRSAINDGLMTLFFLSLGLAARRQISGLSGYGRGTAVIPCLAAVGALVMPALLMKFIPGLSALRFALTLGGLDLGLAIAALAVGGSTPALGRHPLFMFSVALDAGWVLALLFFGTHAVSVSALLLCGGIFLAAFASRWLGARGAVWGILSGVLIWLAWRRTGLPAAVSGVLLAALIPGACAVDERQVTKLAENAIDDYDIAMDDSDADRCSALARRLGDIAVSAEAPIDRWQTGALAWLTWLALPLFGWANGGIPMVGMPVIGAALWVALVFVVGRPAGVFIFGWIARRRMGAEAEESSSELPVLMAISCAGGAPAVMGALILFSGGTAADPFIFWLGALSLATALTGGVLLVARRGKTS